MFQGKAPVVRFVLGFLALLAVFYAIYSPVSQTEFYKGYLGVLAQISALVLRIGGYTISVTGKLLTCPSPLFSLEIVPGCDGMEALALFVAAVLASPVSLRSRLVFAAIGSIGVFAINILRIVSLFLVGAHFPKRFEVLHWDLWPGLLILVIMSSWMIWARRAFRAHVNEAPQREDT